MNIKKTINSIYKISKDIRTIEKSLIYLFLVKNNYNIENLLFFNNYLTGTNMILSGKIADLLEKNNVELDLNTLVSFFELLIPDEERKENGIVFTPKEIKDYIIENLVNDVNPPTVCDPACGCGSFLLSASKFLKNKYGISYKQIFSEYIFGVDIIPHNIEKTKVLLHLLAIVEGEEITDINFNLVVGNSLQIDWQQVFFDKLGGKFDLIIGNPPYVRARKINPLVKETLKKWKTAQVGNPDLYIPFYELGLSILKDNGKLGYISVNTFLKSLNGRELRKLFINNKSQLKIIDFNEEQIFKEVTSYTCIVLIDKANKNDKILYCSYQNSAGLNNLNFTEGYLSQFSKDEKKSWVLGERQDINILNKIQSQPIPLSNFNIKNGLATLKNDLFFFNVINEDESYYYREYKNKIYKIEKGLCVNIAKPNIMKDEEDLEKFLEKGIFPYVTDEQNNHNIISEDTFISEYPEAYNFLSEYKDILNMRDKGKAKDKYPAWYAYGRTQGFNNYGKKILLPYIADRPIAILSLRDDLLFYCGYAVISEDVNELRFLRKILLSNIFWFFIKKTSKPYSKGYMSTAKNYIEQFSIPFFDESEKEFIINEDSQDVLNDFLIEKYNISSEEKEIIESNIN